MTRGSDSKPVRRLMAHVRHGLTEEYVVEIRERVIVIRPKGARAEGPATVSVTVGQVYERALMARVRPMTMPKRRGGR